MLQAYEESLKTGIPVYIESPDLTDISQYYYSLGRRKEAIDVANRAAEMFPGAVDPLAFLARIALFQENDTARARELLEQIDDKADLEYHYMMAEILAVENKADEADRYLEAVYLDLEEEDPDLLAMDVCGIFIDYDRLDIAEKWLARCTATDEDEYKELLGRIQLGKGKAEESEKIFHSLVDRDPFSVPYWNQLATAQLKQNDLSRSIESSDYALAINPDDIEALLNKANAMNSLNNFPEAEKYYRRYLKIMPDNASVMAALAMAIVSVDDNREEEALRILDRGEAVATKLNDKESLCEVLQDKAFIFSRMGGQTDRAIALVDWVIGMSPIKSYEYAVLKGHIYLENDDLPRAQEEFMKAMNESKYDKDICLRVAVSNYDNGYYNLAYKLLKYIIDVHGYDAADVYAYMSLFSNAVGKTDEYDKYKSLAYKRDSGVADRIFGSFGLLNN